MKLSFGKLVVPTFFIISLYSCAQAGGLVAPIPKPNTNTGPSVNKSSPDIFASQPAWVAAENAAVMDYNQAAAELDTNPQAALKGFLAAQLYIRQAGMNGGNSVTQINAWISRGIILAQQKINGPQYVKVSNPSKTTKTAKSSKNLSVQSNSLIGSKSSGSITRRAS